MIGISWDRKPIFLDFETQSAVDIDVGGRLYAQHPSTRVLSCVILVDNVFHVWVPTHISQRTINPDDLWLSMWGPRPTIKIHNTPTFPEECVDPEATYVAHNAFGFDRFIMEQQCGLTQLYWADTLYLARIAGLPGSLDGLSQFLNTGRKDEVKSLLMKLATAEVSHQDHKPVVNYPRADIGTLSVILRYNLQDVRLLQMAWDKFADLKVEADVIEVHEVVNDRGIMFDAELARKLQLVGSQSLERSVEEIEKASDGQLTILDKEEKKRRQRIKSTNKARAKKGKPLLEVPSGPRCIRSTEQVLDWLHEQGISITDPVTGKQTLKKDVVEQHLANPWMMVDDITESPFEAAKNIDPRVFQILRLRGQALRITSAKLERASQRLSPDGRIRDLLTYHVAATGRNSSQGVQIHNLPRPKKGVDVSGLLHSYWTGEWTDQNGYDICKKYLDLNENKFLVVDDAISALIRPCLIPSPGHLFGIADYGQVEARCVAWMAGCDTLLSLFHRNAGVYESMAATVYGIPVEQVTKDQRQVGKTIILGAGYGMSAQKFAIFAGLSGIDLAKAGTTAEACIEAYRSAYPEIAGFEDGRQFNSRKVRSGGVWQMMDRAAKSAIHGGLHSAGRCKFLKVGFDLIMVLPSGREIHYHNARIEDRVPAYAAMFGLPDTPKATLVYDSPRGERSLYGGKLCLGPDTLVPTIHGVKRLIDITTTDRVWDGETWVSHTGVVCQGKKEVGIWLGVLVTGDHLITDGNSWRSVIQSDERFLRRALGWARGSVTSKLSKLRSELRKHEHYANATYAIPHRRSKHVDCSESRLTDVPNVISGRSEIRMQRRQRISFRTRLYAASGSIAIPGWYHAALDQNHKLTTTTAEEAFPFILNGSPIGLHSTDMRRHCRDGIDSTQTWTGSITTEIMHPVTSGLRPDQRTRGIGGSRSTLSTMEHECSESSSGSGTARTSPNPPSTINSNLDGPPSKFWRPMHEEQYVYDLTNCGPHHRFMILTERGPVIVHNCENASQAICRDLMQSAKVNAEHQELCPVIDIHDELVQESPYDDSIEKLNRLVKLMKAGTPWSTDFPIDVEAYLAPCYVKSRIDKSWYATH